MDELSLVLWEWEASPVNGPPEIRGQAWALEDGSGMEELVESAMRERYGLGPGEYEWAWRRLSLPGDVELN